MSHKHNVDLDKVARDGMAFPAKGLSDEWCGQRQQLKKLWNNGCEESGIDSLFADPLVEFSFPYEDDERGRLDDLCAKEEATFERPLHPKLVGLLNKTAMKDWAFKHHQVEAFRQSIDHIKADGSLHKAKSVIVSSGTGSGKTESFLIPMMKKKKIKSQINSWNTLVMKFSKERIQN